MEYGEKVHPVSPVATGGGVWYNVPHMNIQRREFLRAASAASILAFPALRASAASPNGKVNMAFIGIGNRGYSDFSMFVYYKDMVNVVALCDTQMGAAHTERVLKAYPQVPRFTDFRAMFDKLGPQIDAVCIATPDFSHFPAAMLAMSLGKAVFCEKPLGNNFREIELMVRAARKYKVVTQMGNQGHSDGNYWQCRALVKKGFLKDVTRINAFMCASRRWHKWKGSMAEMPGGETPPAELDWDVWQSQRPARSYSVNYINGDWRCFYEYGTGALGDWGAHIFDAPWELLKFGLPEKIEVLRDKGKTAAVYPMTSDLVYHFPARGPGLPACRLEWRDGIGNFPPLPKKLSDPKWKRAKPYGSEIYTADGRVFARGTHGDVMTAIAGLDPKDPQVKKTLRDFPRGKSGHYLSFIRAVRGEEKTTSPFEKSGPLSQVMALGALAQRLGEGVLTFDRKTKRFVDNDRANAFLDGPPHRKGWEQFEKLGA